MKILVTGATGFVGSRLLSKLRGHEVFALGRNLEAGKKLEQTGATFIAADLSQPLKNLPAKIDAVVHCAALSSVWGSRQDFERSNVIGTQNIVNYALHSKCQRFVHISSPSIYVSRQDRLGVREDDTLPRLNLNEYIRSKKLAEQIVDQAQINGLSTLTLRPQGIVGAGDRAIFPRILATAKRGFFPRIGRGETLTDLTHVENVLQAIELSLNASEKYAGRKYNITNGEPVEIYAFISELLKRLDIAFRWKPISFTKAYVIASALELVQRGLNPNREPLLTRYSVCALGRDRTLNIDRARNELGYDPQLFPLARAMDEIRGAK